jgi:hypothetical protein
MNIEIQSFNNDPTSIIKQCKILDPDIKIEENKMIDFKRLLRKLIRERNIILSMYHVQFKITCPIFVYCNIKNIIPGWNISLVNPINDDITFESYEKFNSTEEAALISLFKKIKSITKGMDKNKLKYFLPMSYHVDFLMYLDILQIYELIFRISSIQNIDDKMEEFQYLFMKTLSDRDIVFFNEQLVEVYRTTEERA